MSGFFSRNNGNLSSRRNKSERPVVVRIIGRLNGGGPARQVCVLQEKLADKFETHLVIGSLAEGEQDMSYLLHSERNVLRLPQMSREISLWRDTIAFCRILKFLARVRPDIVHTHTGKAGAVGRMAAWLAGVPVIVHTYHGHFFHGYFGPMRTRIYLGIERMLGRRTTQLIAVSESQKQELCLKYRVASAESIRVIHNGIDLEHFSQPRRNEARAALGIPQDAFVAAWAGRMVPVKDVDLLAQVIRLARERGSKISFLVVGDGAEKAKLESLVRDYDNVQLLGWQDHIEQIWFAADVVLLTSRNEGTPMNLIESMAAGRPFVATHVGGVHDLAVPPLVETPSGMGYQAANGFVTARTPEALLHCLEIIRTDPQLGARMGSVGCGFVWKQFSVPRMVEEISTLYESLLSKSVGVAPVSVHPPEEGASGAKDLM